MLFPQMTSPVRSVFHPLRTFNGAQPWISAFDPFRTFAG